MSITLTHDCPKQIVAGDSIEFLVAIPTDLVSWTASARLTGASTMNATSTAIETSDVHVLFSGQATTGTKGLTAGQYLLTVWMTSGNERYTIAQFPITVTPDLSTGTPALAHAVQTLSVIETGIYNRINGTTDGGIEEYAINGTQVKKIPLEQLYRLRARYTAEVARLSNPNQPFGKVKFAMTQAGTLPELRRRFS